MEPAWTPSPKLATKASVWGCFPAQPERPLGFPWASISYSAQPAFNTKRGKGGIEGG